MSSAVQCPKCKKRLTAEPGSTWVLCPACGTRVVTGSRVERPTLPPEAPGDAEVVSAPRIPSNEEASRVPWIIGSVCALAVGMTIGLAIFWSKSSVASTDPPPVASVKPVAEVALRVPETSDVDQKPSGLFFGPPGTVSIQPSNVRKIADKVDSIPVQVSAAPPPRGSDFDPALAGEAPVTISPPASMPATTEPTTVLVPIDPRRGTRSADRCGDSARGGLPP